MIIIKKIIGFTLLIIISFFAANLVRDLLFLLKIFPPPLPGPIDQSWVDIIDSVVYAPLSEEFLFRGPIYFILKIAQVKKEKLSKKSALLIALILLFWSGLIFALAHVEWGSRIFLNDQKIKSFLYYTASKMWTGLFLGFLVYKTKSLIPSILVHSLINLAALPYVILL